VDTLAKFCYRVSAEAKIAHNTETKEPTEAYIKFNILDKKEENIILVPCKTYCKIHLKGILSLAKKLQLNPDWLEPITMEEYSENVEDD